METLDDIGIKLCDGGTERTSVVYLSVFFCLFTLCSASVNELHIVFSNSSYKSTAKWETCPIFKEDKLLVRV
jgi:hypothetical protein